MNIDELYRLYLKYPKICTDTRTISQDCLFFALKGEHFDANTFAQKAIAEGAAYCIIDHPDYAVDKRCILVEDVLTTLQDLARHHRKQLNIPFIGLTGSNGKTTTKELIRAVLAEKFHVFATFGNLNNHIGVPLSILSIDSSIEIAVIEMGANHQREIEFLCGIAQPTHGLISNVGMAHLDGFGGFEGVKKGKGELYRFLADNKGYVFVNANNPDLMQMLQQSGAKNVVPYLSKHRNIVHGELLSGDPFIELEWSYLGKKHRANSHLTGTYNFENILAAIGIGCFFKLNPEQINQGLANYMPTNNRSQLNTTEHNKVIADFYNANPSSMIVAIKNLHDLSAKKKIAILGDMFELGCESAGQHRHIIELALEQSFEDTVFIGEYFYQWNTAYQANFFKNRDEAFHYIKKQGWIGCLILLKGSRGMALEKLLPLL